jgi:hypothetical protein
MAAAQLAQRRATAARPCAAAPRTSRESLRELDAAAGTALAVTRSAMPTRPLPTPITRTTPTTSSTSTSRPRRRARLHVLLPTLLLAPTLLLILTSRPGIASASGDGIARITLASDAVAQACPCSGPVSGGSWRSHGQYLSCVGREARRAARMSALSPRETRAIVRDGARTTCGKTTRIPGNVRVCEHNPSLPCPTVQSARVDDCAECDAALAGKLVSCARVAGASGAEAAFCGTPARIRAFGKKVVERRTGVDCASCTAKLGTPAGSGFDCVVAACDTAAPGF